jgi:hydroxymethylpyrimidine/phosphomethylpyrimidine kinase
LITPNIPEAETLTGLEIHTVDDMRHAAEMLFTLGAPAVLVKGGHLAGNKSTDVLLSEDGEVVFESERINSRSTHGTGCTLASGIATGIAQGLSIPDAVARARTYLRAAIINAPGYGRGHGPLDHGVTVGEIPNL